MKDKKRILLQLFLSTLYLSAFTFGGGYVIVTLMKHKFVDQYHWIEEREMLDLIAIAQSAPGAVAVNGAIVIGYQLAGAAGVVTAVIATVLPPFVIISVVSFFYELFQSNIWVQTLLEGMQAGVGAVIAVVVYDMTCGIIKEKDKWSVVIMILAFVAAYFIKVNVILIVLVCGTYGAIRAVLRTKGGKI